MTSVLEDRRPQDAYDLAARSFVPISWTQPVFTARFTALGVTRSLGAIRLVDPGIRFHQASSSETSGKVRETPQTERAPFHPRSPCGVAGCTATLFTVNSARTTALARESCSTMGGHGGFEFVTREVTNAAARIQHGLQQEACMANLDARYDWGLRATTFRRCG